MSRIEINQKVLSKNDIVAQRIRNRFNSNKTFVMNLASSPGSGKTTLLEKLLPSLAKKWNIAVIEGDLRTENDAERLRKLGIKAIQIQTGDACHLEALQIETLLDDDMDKLDLLIIENIGNLVCPASYDLGEDAFFVMLSATEGDDKPSKYPTIFHNADYFILNKIDLLPYVDFNVDTCMKNALSINARLETFTVSARSKEGLDKLMDKISSLIEAKKVTK